MAGISLGVFASSGNKFNPGQIANLAAWYDATDPATTINTANRVNLWLDKSGNNNNAAQATGALQPLLVASGINGKPTIQFFDTATTTGLSVPYSPSLFATEFTYFAVCNHLASTTQNEFIIAQWGITVAKQAGLILTGASVTDVLTSTDGNTTLGVTGGTPSNNTPFVLRGTYANSDHIVSNSLNNVSPSTGTLGGNLNQVGAIMGLGYFDEQNSTFANGFNGYISELLYYTRRLNSTEIGKVNAYFTAKYGIAL